MIVSLGLAMSVSAQKIHRGYHSYRQPRVVVSLGAYGPLYPYYGYGLPYPYYGYPSPYMYGHRPTRLEMQLQSIRDDYKDRIYSARHDRSLTHRQRREVIRQLKKERDREIENLRSSYYKSRYNK
jgi:hypothetical protein